MQNHSPRTLQYSSFPKIKRKLGTAYSSKTFSTPDLRQPTADSIAMREIERRIEDQRKDLEERSLAIKTLLTHFENIASMCRDEKNKNIQFRQQNMELIKEIKFLKKIIEEKNTQNERPVRQKTQSTISIVNVEEYEGIWKENDRLKESIKKFEKDNSERFREINGLHERITSLKQIIAGLNKNLEEQNLDRNVLRSNKRKLEEDVSNALKHNERLEENIKEKDEEIEKLTERVTMLNLDIEKLYETLEQKDKEVQKVRTWNNKLSTQNQEYLNNKTKEGGALYQFEIDSNDTLELIIDKFTKAMSIKDDKVIELEREITKLNDKINKSTLARKELLVSVEEFRNNNQSEILKYEKLLQQLENTKKLKDSEIKDLKESLHRIESQKRGYMEDIQGVELQLYNEKQQVSLLSKKKEELDSEIQKLLLKLESKAEEILGKEKKIEHLHDVKLKFKLSQKEIKAVRDENMKLERQNELLSEKYMKEKNAWNHEEMSLHKKIQDLQEELNNEKIFNSIHLKELTKLKTALSAQDNRFSKDQAQEEERKLRAKIATLEMDLAEQLETSSKLSKNLDYSSTQLQEKNSLIFELEDKLGTALDQLNHPNFTNTVEKAKKLKSREFALLTEVSKISYAIQAFENGMACIVCLSCLDNPILVVPCGHAVCNKCLNLTSLSCPQCNEKIQGQYRIDWLDQLVDKIGFQRQILDAIKALMGKEIFV